MPAFISGFIQEFGPVTAFFLTTVWADFMTGVAVLVGSTVLSVFWGAYSSKRIPWFAVVAGSSVIVTGLITLANDNPRWIIAEYTLSNAVFAAAMLGGTWLGYLPMKPLFAPLFAITDYAWRTLATRWGWVFLAGALGSELTWLLLGEAWWAYYRFFSAGVFLLFGLWQFRLARRERLPDATRWGLRR